MTDIELPASKFGKRNPQTGRTEPDERPGLDFRGQPYEHTPNVVYRRLPNTPTVCVAVPAGLRCTSSDLEALEAEYKAGNTPAAVKRTASTSES